MRGMSNRAFLLRGRRIFGELQRLIENFPKIFESGLDTGGTVHNAEGSHLPFRQRESFPQAKKAPPRKQELRRKRDCNLVRRLRLDSGRGKPYRRSQAVRQGTLTPSFAGSNPAVCARSSAHAKYKLNGLPGIEHKKEAETCTYRG